MEFASIDREVHIDASPEVVFEVMRLRNWIVGVCALLAAGAAQAQDAEEHYAKVGAWEIAAEPARNLCKMYRYYGSSVDDHIEGLVVRYDATKAVWLTWSTDGSTPFPGDGQIDLYLNFLTGKSINEKWGSRTFRHGKPEDTRYFASVFNGSKDSLRILRDLAENDLIGLYLGPTLMTALSLDATEATQALRDCSLKIAGRVPAGPLLK